MRFCVVFICVSAAFGEKTRDSLHVPNFPLNGAIAGQTGYTIPTQAAATQNPVYLSYGEQNALFAAGIFGPNIRGFQFGGALFSPFGGLALSGEYLAAEDKTFALRFGYGSFITRRFATGVSLTPRYTTDSGKGAFGLGLDPSLLFDSKWHTSFGQNDGFGVYSPSLYMSSRNLNIPIGETDLLPKASVHLGMLAGFYQSTNVNVALMVSTHGTNSFDTLPLNLGVQGQYHWALLSLGYGSSNYTNQTNGFSLGVGANISTGFGDAWLFYSLAVANSSRSEVHGIAAGARFGGVDSEPPEIEITPDGSHFSPNNDGVRDLIYFSVKVRDKSPIVFFELVIRDKKGAVVHRQRADERIREKEFHWSLFFRSFVSPRSRADIPERLTWNGRMIADSKKPVKDNLFTDEPTDAPLPDGAYNYEFRAIDEKNNESRRVTGEIYIDTVEPVATIEISDDLISPNGDGRRDMITVTQDTTATDLYEGAILNAACKQIRHFSFSSPALTRFDFDGKQDNGTVAEEGVYRYQLTGRDAAGNQKTALSSNFYLTRRVDAATLKSNAVGLNPKNKKFAELVLYPAVEYPQGFIDGEILINKTCDFKKDSLAYRIAIPSLKPDKKKPAAFIWRGQGLGQTVVGDGLYCVIFRARYENGNAPESTPLQFLVDSTGPELDATADLSSREFSPDGDNENEEQAFRLFARDLSQISAYELTIREVYPDQKLNIVRRFAGKDEIPATIYWDGRTDQAGLVESLTQYEYTFSATDTLGNTSITTPRRFETGVLALAQQNGFLIRVPLKDLEEPLADRFDALYRALSRYPKYRVRIEVHASPGGGIERGLKASEVMAHRLHDFLKDKGLTPAHLSYQGFGESNPIYSLKSLNTQKNLRADIFLNR